jgi:hypothetical protein
MYSISLPDPKDGIESGFGDGGHQKTVALVLGSN